MLSMCNRTARFVGVLCILTGITGLLPWATPVAAGQGAGNPAGISGVITDNSGAILPGVTVTATGPALQVPSVTSVSDERGEYRLSPLPIGVYTVLFELPGFQNVRREGIRLTVGFTARVDAEMNVGAVSETITVSGASPLVDTTSTATSSSPRSTTPSARCRSRCSSTASRRTRAWCRWCWRCSRSPRR